MVSWKSTACVLAVCIGMVLSHSWLDIPACRYPADPNYCEKYDNGTLVTPAVCGKDAQATDLFVLRPTTYYQNPCYYPAGHTFHDAPNGVAEVNSIMCLLWAANAHDSDPSRDNGGGVRISLSTVLTNPTQADFDKMIVAHIPYDRFLGAKIQLPNIPAGDYLLQWYWYWPTPGGVERLFVSCSDLSIVPTGDQRLTTQQSTQWKMGLPVGFSPDQANWHCNTGDTVYANASLPSGTQTPGTRAPGSGTQAPGSGTQAPTSSPPSTQAPGTGTQSPSSSPSTRAPVSPTRTPGSTPSPTNQPSHASALSVGYMAVILLALLALY